MMCLVLMWSLAAHAEPDLPPDIPVTLSVDEEPAADEDAVVWVAASAELVDEVVNATPNAPEPAFYEPVLEVLAYCVPSIVAGYHQLEAVFALLVLLTAGVLTEVRLRLSSWLRRAATFTGWGVLRRLAVRLETTAAVPVEAGGDLPPAHKLMLREKIKRLQQENDLLAKSLNQTKTQNTLLQQRSAKLEVLLSSSARNALEAAGYEP